MIPPTSPGPESLGAALPGFARESGAAGAMAGTSAGADFASILAVEQRLRPGAEGGEDGARQTAERFVAVTLIQPALKHLRENNQAAPPFGPAPGEKEFGALLDAQLALEISRAAQFPLVDRVARDLLQRPSQTESAGGDPPQPTRSQQDAARHTEQG